MFERERRDSLGGHARVQTSYPVYGANAENIPEGDILQMAHAASV